MTRRFLPASNLVIFRTLSAIVLLLVVLAVCGLPATAWQQSSTQGPKIWLADRQPLPMQGAPAAPRGAAGLLGATAAVPQPLSLVSADIDEDGFPDLLVGYAGYITVQRGNVDAFAPQSDASFQAIAHGQFPAPFLAQTLTIAVPVSPDFIAVGRFTGSGHNDLVIAAKGGNALYVFSGDGKGNFAAPQSVPLPGGVTALAGGDLGHATGFNKVVVGVTAQSGAELAIFGGSQDGLAPVAAFPLSGPASSLNFGDFGDGGNDLAFLAGGKVQILRSATMKLQQVSLPISASSLALGTFVIDRAPGLQMALLTSDGAIHIAAHNEFDPRAYTVDELHAIRTAVKMRTNANPLLPARFFPANGWKIVEDIAAAATFTASQPPVLFRTRISDHQMDDVMVLNGSTGQLTVVAHPDVQPGATTFVPAQLSIRPYAGLPVAAFPARINVDGRPGVLAIHTGEAAPSMLMPLPDPTFTVNTTNDLVSAGACAAATPGQCSLREAIIEANAAVGTDTIIVPAGTYTLTIARNAADHHSSLTGTLEVQDSVNIVGAGQATTIIQGGTNLTTSVDKVISFNQDIDSFTDASVSVSNLTIQNGHNRGDCCATADGFGGAFDFDTGSPGTATLTMTNVTIQNNAIFDGQGGGFTMFNTLSGTGFATLTNVLVQNNDSTPNASGCCGDGGGGVIDARSKIVMSNVQVLNNHAHSGGSPLTHATGGGLFLSGQHTQPQSHISGGAISNNTADGIGGGMNSAATLLIDGGTVISNNTATATGFTSGFGGGGIYNNANDGLTISKVTITGNSTGESGGGIYSGSVAAGFPLSITFSRIAGNTASVVPGSSNLFNRDDKITAQNNWWGTNTPGNTISNNGSPATSVCPATADANTCFDPWIELTHTASPAIIKINQSTTLTGDMSKDNHGNGAVLAGNLDVLNGLPITFNNPVLGTIPQAQPETLNAGAQATATFNAGGTSGTGHADATVDQATVTANIVILEPLRIVKSFNPATVAVNASSALTFNVDNPNVIAVDASFTDTLPAGLVVAATPGVTNSCGGTVTATAGSGSVSFSNASLPVGACTITVNVSSAVDNVYSNSVTINSTAAGTGALSTSSANLTVINPPSIAKAFGAATIPLNGITSLTFTVSSSNANLTLNGVAFTDNLPPGLVIATPGNLTSNCSGTATAVDGSSSVSLSGASLAPGTSCTVSVNVQGTTAGVKNNSVQVTSTNGGTGNTSNASTTVVAPPTIAKVFGAVSIPLNGSTSLSFTISNPNTTVALTGVGFSDTLPAGLIISTPNGLTGTCGAGTITATQGTNTISLSGGTIAANSSCTFSVNVTGIAAGAQNNTTGNVTSTEGGTGGTASTSISVVAPPSIAKAFGAAAIPLNGTTTLTFTITNPAANTVAENGVAFTDTLPTGLVVSTPNGLANTCGGTATAVAGSTSISLTGGSIAVNTNCTLVVNVTGTASGQYTNTTGPVTSTNGGTGNTATANLTVATPPSITKAFGAASIPLNGTTSLTFSITNPNTNVALSGIAFTDNLPAGLVVATPNGLNNTCGGTVTAVAGSGSISLSGGTLASSASC
ncbi:MAG TPA: VCBS repeat-containing protein, partial [Candidatus Angelobacter sp.]|nr:VCBS repeat-containing protein [Candidatus Angelobacter sp.]